MTSTKLQKLYKLLKNLDIISKYVNTPFVRIVKIQTLKSIICMNLLINWEDESQIDEYVDITTLVVNEYENEKQHGR